MLHFWSPLSLSKFPVNGPPSSPSGPYGERHLFPELSSTFPLVIHLSLNISGKWAPLHVPQQDPYGERCFVSRASGLFIHLYLLESPIKDIYHKNGENIWSPSMEPHMDGRPTYNGVQPSSLRGSITTLLSLFQCHAAFSIVPSTLSWVDQSPISQHVL